MIREIMCWLGIHGERLIVDEVFWVGQPAEINHGMRPVYECQRCGRCFL